MKDQRLNYTIFGMPGINQRACNALCHIDAQTIGELVKLTKKQLLQIPNCGKKTVAVIESALARMGLQLARK
jgi:DNA-directed RNA polymerase alpha subunit